MAMNKKANNTEIKHAVDTLEARVNELVKLTNTLKTENAALRQQNTSLLNDRNELMGQKATVKSSVENMITKLRAMESV